MPIERDEAAPSVTAAWCRKAPKYFVTCNSENVEFVIKILKPPYLCLYKKEITNESSAKPCRFTNA